MPYMHNHHRRGHHQYGGGGHQNILRGHVAVTVGPDHQRFVVPVAYVNHPLFTDLLKEAEEEYGFSYQEGPIILPCHVEGFCRVMGLIEEETASYHHRLHHENSLSNHHHQFLCFKA